MLMSRASVSRLSGMNLTSMLLQWRTRLRACVKAKGGHFERRLVQNDRLQECFKFCIKNMSDINDFTLTYL